tara:strand:- start:2228 stop:2986 length:759 start_codon:yes stop_codon:yes gene_type:complete
MNFTPEQLQENFEKFISLIDKHIEGERKDQLIKFYRDHEERVMLMPASGNINYHNCFIGGYVDHVNRVVELTLQVHDLWKSAKANINYTTEELVFAAINHDLGKIGTEQATQYISNPSDWHRKNQGKIYINNPDNSFMTVPDRSLKLLADRGIKVSDNEWYGIKLHDGMYEEANKPYYVSWNPDSALRTNLPHVLHQGDMMASKVELDIQRAVEGSPNQQQVGGRAKAKDKVAGAFKDSDKTALKSAFDNLF